MNKILVYVLIALMLIVGVVVSVKALNTETKGWSFLDPKEAETIDPIDPPEDPPLEGQDVYADDVIMRSSNGDRWIVDVSDKGELLIRKLE